jgi:hypothetical protein
MRVFYPAKQLRTGVSLGTSPRLRDAILTMATIAHEIQQVAPEEVNGLNVEHGWKNDAFELEPIERRRRKNMRPIIVGISGATGIASGIRALAMLRELGVETHLVLSTGAKMTVHEVSMTIPQIEALATHVHHQEDSGASIASGSFRTAGMIMPCSMRCLSRAPQ